MGIKVAKFGGSSVADGIQLEKIRNIIKSDSDRRYIIVSAPGKRYEGDSKITDLLMLCRQHLEHNIPYEQLFQAVIDRYSAIKYNLEIEVDMESEYDKIRRDMEAGASSQYVVSRGEYLSARLVAAYLGFDFVDSAGMIRFDKRGRLLAEETNEAIKEELSKHSNAVIPGFYGTYGDTDEICTFSRGGSDVTGAIVSRAVGADAYENWTDVSGLLMADPRIIEDPAPIKQISYVELRELSYMGAKVLHEDAIFPVRLSNIPINIRNTNEPEDSGTIITTEEHPDKEKIVSGIAGKSNYTVIAIYKNMMNREVGFVRKALMILEDFGISFEHVPTGIDTMSLVISDSDLDGKLNDVINAFNVQLEPDELKVHENISLIATVGLGMSRRTGVSARIFTALSNQGVNIRMINQGSSEINIIIGVETVDFKRAIRAIYNEFNK